MTESKTQKKTTKTTNSGKPKSGKVPPGKTPPKKTNKTKKLPAKKNNPESSSIKYILTALILIAFILVGSIIILDQKAMKKGQIGLLESFTGVRPARTIADVENQTIKVLNDFGIGSDSLRRKGFTSLTARTDKKLRHLIYYVSDEKIFKQLISEFEDRESENGVRVHNRHVIKQPRKWIVTFYLGTHSARMIKLDIHYFLTGTPTPIPIPEKYLNQITPTPTVVTTKKNNLPRVCLVFDDFGQSTSLAKRFLEELDIPLTLAVIPYQPHSKEVIQIIRKYHQTALLHMPMEPQNPDAMGTEKNIFLTTTMDDATLHEKTRKMLDDYKNVHGVNNHTGSKMTSNRHCMKIVLSEIKRKHLFFLDSRTIASTIAEDLAREMGIATESRDIFIDQGFNGGDVKAKMAELITKAEKNGYAIGIGHAIDRTLEQVKEALSELQTEKVEFVSIQSLIH